MYPERLNAFRFILASKSPRRQFLLRELGIPFELETKDVDESFPEHLQGEDIPLYLCRKKADAFERELDDKTIVITADTVVWINNHVLNKPADEDEARVMLRELSGNRHEVFTGVCLKSKRREIAFAARTEVFFRELTEGEIDYYVRNFKPLDKAGAYGAQEWIGYVGVDRIIGSYFNVMGLPVKELYEELGKF
jgi:septum formation protein